MWQNPNREGLLPNLTCFCIPFVGIWWIPSWRYDEIDRFLTGKLQSNPAEMPRMHIACISFFWCNTKLILLLNQKTRRITSRQPVFFTHKNCRLQHSTDTFQGLNKQGPFVQSSMLTADPWALCYSAPVELMGPFEGLLITAEHKWDSQ